MDANNNKAKLGNIKDDLTSIDIDLENWLLKQWDAQPVVKANANKGVLREIALEIIDILSNCPDNGLLHESAGYSDDVIELVVWIDKERRTISTATKDKNSGYVVNTGEDLLI